MNRQTCIEFFINHLDIHVFSCFIEDITDHSMINEYSFVPLHAEVLFLGHQTSSQYFGVYFQEQRVGQCVMVYSPKDLEYIEKEQRKISNNRDIMIIYAHGDELVIQCWNSTKKTEARWEQAKKEASSKNLMGVLECFVHDKIVLSPQELATLLVSKTKQFTMLLEGQVHRSWEKVHAKEEWEIHKKVCQRDWTHNIWDDLPLLKIYIFVHTKLMGLGELSSATDRKKGISIFCDMYAQTVTYGLFAARWISKKNDIPYTIDNINRLLPCTSDVVEELFYQLIYVQAGAEVESCIYNIYAHLSIVDIRAVFDHTSDPILHFYEDFLDVLEKDVKKSRGVYYTPDVVVDFIVCSIDEQLKKKFKLPLGLASTQTWKEVLCSLNADVSVLPKSAKDTDVFVRVLDPATGTGTFITRVIEQIHTNLIEHWSSLGWSTMEQEKEWVSYVRGRKGIEKDYSGCALLSRLYAFELMPTPYVITHLRLGILFQQYSDMPRFSAEDDRVHVLLTNALEHPKDMSFDKERSTEEEKADLIKTTVPITVVLGNPPYRGVTSNNTDWITQHLEAYKYIHGAYFGERKHWLNDDYVRFVRLGELYLTRSKIGVLGYIHPHGFLDNPTFRGMRKHLLDSFDDLHILNLHGNVRRAEKVKHEERDENIFKIMQGVSINIYTKYQCVPLEKSSLGMVYTHDIYGSRIRKYHFLGQNRLGSIDWHPVSMKMYTKDFDYYFMVPKDFGRLTRYLNGFSLCDLFMLYTSGIVTARDAVVIDTDKQVLQKRIEQFFDLSYHDDWIRRSLFPNKKDGKYKAGDTRGWKLSVQRRKKQTQPYQENIQKISYRPFDSRFIFYTSEMVDWGREAVMSHFIRGDNLGLIFKRGDVQPSTAPVFMTKNLIDFRAWSRPGMQGGDSVAPLYQYQHGVVSSNVNKTILSRIQDICGREELCTPENLLDYVYAVSHTPSYFDCFADFLSIDYPRIPYPKNSTNFWTLVLKGRELRRLHLLESDWLRDVPSILRNKDGSRAENSKEITECRPKASTMKLSKNVKEWNGQIWINSSQYFEKVPKYVWELYIGGYQPAQKWIKDRKQTKSKVGICLTLEDVLQYSIIIKVLMETHRIMDELEVIEKAMGISI